MTPARAGLAGLAFPGWTDDHLNHFVADVNGRVAGRRWLRSGLGSGHHQVVTSNRKGGNAPAR